MLALGHLIVKDMVGIF